MKISTPLLLLAFVVSQTESLKSDLPFAHLFSAPALPPKLLLKFKREGKPDACLTAGTLDGFLKVRGCLSEENPTGNLITIADQTWRWYPGGQLKPEMDNKYCVELESDLPQTPIPHPNGISLRLKLAKCKGRGTLHPLDRQNFYPNGKDNQAHTVLNAKWLQPVSEFLNPQEKTEKLYFSMSDTLDIPVEDGEEMEDGLPATASNIDYADLSFDVEFYMLENREENL
eukprot:GHVL01032640.1.p1 GENE.GHVL01032640.1~~GHVL01032640.1.p1  ORF type:complete len:228 (+),score=48.66 GHVL01032640.1:80-763(+)